MSFDEVIGQQEAKERLMQMVEEGRLPHAMMLCGPHGCGKFALATAFASHLLDNGTPSAKAMLDKLEHPDLHFTYPTIKLSSMSADHKPVSDDFAKEWHELLKQGPYFTMEDMNSECANKLLKLIEEPPQQTVFIMVCEEPDKLIETIRSRVQRIDVRRLAEEDIQEALVSRRGIDAEMARRISRLANGSWLKALEELQVGSENELFLDIWLTFFLRMTRENFMYNFQNEELVYMTQKEEDFARNFARFVNEKNILQMNDMANLCIRDIGQNANAKIVFFDFALQMIVLLLQK